MDLLDFNIRAKHRKHDPRILLDSGPPRALYGVNPRLILGKQWWDTVRAKAYKEFNHSCAACGAVNKKLDAHELYEINKTTGKVYLKDVVPVCGDCHSFIHQDLHRDLLRKGAIKTSDVVRILAHGVSVLKKAGIRNVRKDPNTSKIHHDQWRLVIGTNEYAPVYKER